jgi:OmpA-OmpF porin, OOP family
MFKPTVIIALCLIAGAQVALAQLSTSSKRAEKLYEESKEYLRNRDFGRCTTALEKAIEADPKFWEAHFSLAMACNTLREVDKAERHFRESTGLLPDDRRLAQAYYQVAVADFQKGDYGAAKANFEKFVKYGTNKGQVAEAQKNLNACAYAVEGMKNPLPFNPRPVGGNVNRQPLQYFPVLTGDQQQIIFTARIGTEAKNDENIYVCSKKNGEWGEPEYIRELNTFFNEGTCTISADGKAMIFTVCQGSEERSVIGSCDLFVTYKVNGKWQTPRNMGNLVNSPHWDTQPSLSADGRTLYFVSDRPGGLGAEDIWRTRRDDTGNWGRAENLGSQVNTRGHEYAPFIHVNGKTLYFSSDGYPGYGGYDLFKAELKGGAWQTPQNLGYPLNDHRNQVGLFVTADSKKGYYSHEENKGGRLVGSQIYEFELPEQLKPQTASNYVKGTVYDAKTKQRLEAKIDLIDLATDSTESTVASDPGDGGYLITLNKGSEYALYVNKANYLFQSLSFNYSANEGKDVEIDIYLDPAGKGSRITLNNLFFESGKWDLQAKSKTELNRLLGFMKQNKGIRVEIGGHTDDVGADASNLELSRKRAQAVVDYLTKAGIEAGRLISKGYGEGQPKAPNDSDANRALNRRIEFLIL